MLRANFLNRYGLAATIASMVFLIALVHPTAVQSQTVYADGLNGPLGIAVDSRGWLWVAEIGTANNDSRISIVTTDGERHSFMIGLPSETNATGEVAGSNHTYFAPDGDLVIVQGEGTNANAASILFVDTTGFTPGDTPLGVNAIAEKYDIGSFSLGEGFAESNPYSLAWDSNGDLFVVDAAANAIIKRDQSSGDLSVFATFPDVPNDTGIGQSMVDAVPTGIVYSSNHFYVGSLTGFPFGDNAARIYEVDSNGTLATLKDELTTVVDVALYDGTLFYLQHAAFKPPPPFQANSGGVYKLVEGEAVAVVTGLNLPAGMAFAENGDLFVSLVRDGEILKIDSSVITDVGDPENLSPQGFALLPNYPNPFNPATVIPYRLDRQSEIEVTVYNHLGQHVKTLVQGRQPAGEHQVTWDGSDENGNRVASGLYFYRLRTGTQTQVRKMILFK